MEAAATGMITLRNGVAMPSIGIGTYQAGGSTLYNSLIAALQHGVRHIDTARMYKNEAVVAAAVRDSGAQGVFITSKLSPYEQGTDKARAACEATLATFAPLGRPLDCMLIHWPGAANRDVADAANARLRLETWRVLEELYKAGRIRSLGVSNYTAAHLRELLDVAEVPPMVNQVEMHVQYPQHALCAFCRSANIAVMSYSTLGRGALLSDPTVGSIAAACGRTPAQVLLRWALQRGCGVVPKSDHVERVVQQTPDTLLSWSLDDAQLAALDGLEDGTKYCWCPDGVA